MCAHSQRDATAQWENWLQMLHYSPLEGLAIQAVIWKLNQRCVSIIPYLPDECERALVNKSGCEWCTAINHWEWDKTSGCWEYSLNSRTILRCRHVGICLTNRGIDKYWTHVRGMWSRVIPKSPSSVCMHISCVLQANCFFTNNIKVFLVSHDILFLIYTEHTDYLVSEYQIK